ncbi:MAG TPA: alpha/beta hydrolase-fold protein [Longimicrobium sp.]|nr:alpha/beta hydrolase-fold protein [Longimicrobium sp.]
MTQRHDLVHPRHASRAAAGLLVAGLLYAAPGAAQLTIRITGVPAGTAGDIYVAGSFNNWNPADSAYRLSASGGEYVITLPPSIRGAVEFKFTRGSWETVEMGQAGDGVSNRRFTVPENGAVTYEASVAAWRDPATAPRIASTAGPNVSVLDTAFAIPQLGRTRRVWIYLPPDYATSDKTYPVLYMHDGQNVFDAATSYAGEWGVDETLDSLHAAGDRGVIVVAVDHGGQRRLDEYSPWRNARMQTGGEGDAYAGFLVNTLKPWIDARFRTRPGREDTGIAGSSMGGLISLYAALEYPDVFGRAGVFSPAFWFAGDSAFAHAAGAAPPRPGTRFYFVTGAQEGSEPRVYVRDHQRMVETLAAAGYRPGAETEALVRADGTHSEWFWRREFPAAYRWLFSQTQPGAPR